VNAADTQQSDLSLPRLVMAIAVTILDFICMRFHGHA
jgi:hypothetical protein